MSWYPKKVDISSTVSLSEAELTVLDAVTKGTAAANKAVVLGGTGKIDTIDITAPKFNGVSVAGVQSVSKVIAVASMTDNTNTTGYIDFAGSALPASSLVLGWKCVTTAGFAGDTTATIQVGIAGTLDLYSAVTTGSVFAPGTVGSVVKTTGVYFQAAAATPRVTITGSADFTSIVTNGLGAATVTMYYVPLG
jgi:hypothetical protein